MVYKHRTKSGKFINFRSKGTYEKWKRGMFANRSNPISKTKKMKHKKSFNKSARIKRVISRKRTTDQENPRMSHAAISELEAIERHLSQSQEAQEKDLGEQAGTVYGQPTEQWMSNPKTSDVKGIDTKTSAVFGKTEHLKARAGHLQRMKHKSPKKNRKQLDIYMERMMDSADKYNKNPEFYKKAEQHMVTLRNTGQISKQDYNYVDDKYLAEFNQRAYEPKMFRNKRMQHKSPKTKFKRINENKKTKIRNAIKKINKTLPDDWKKAETEYLVKNIQKNTKGVSKKEIHNEILNHNLDYGILFNLGIGTKTIPSTKAMSEINFKRAEILR